MRRTTHGRLLLLCCVGTVACAEPVALPAAAPVLLKINNLEQINLANNLAAPGYAPAAGQQGNWGVFIVASIERGVVASPNIDISPSGTIVFADDGPGGSAGQITGIIYDIRMTSPTTSTGGTIDFFWNNPNATYIPGSCLSGATCAPDAAAVALFTAGTFLARVKLASGIDPSSPLTFTKSSSDMTAPGGIGESAGFADVDTSMVGPWTAALNGDWFTTSFGARDLRLTTFFRVDVASWSMSSAGTAGIRSNDPIRVFTH